MRLEPCLVKRFLWRSAGPFAVAAALVSGSPSLAAEDARLIPAKPPAKKAAASVAAPTTAAAPAEAPKVAEPCPPETAGEAGMRAFIDPQTGQLRAPTAEEAAQLSRGGERRALAAGVAPQLVQHPSGAVSAQLGEEFMNDFVVRKNADGTLSMVCVPRSQREKALEKPAPPKSRELEKE